MLAYDPDFPPPDANQEGKLPFQMTSFFNGLIVTNYRLILSSLSRSFVSHVNKRLGKQQHGDGPERDASLVVIRKRVRVGQQ